MVSELEQAASTAKMQRLAIIGKVMIGFLLKLLVLYRGTHHEVNQGRC